MHLSRDLQKFHGFFFRAVQSFHKRPCGFGFAFSPTFSSTFCSGFFCCFCAFNAESHFEHHVFTLLLLSLFYGMDAFLDVLDERIITDFSIHVVE